MSLFLTARWRHLVLLNYAVADDVLRDLLPPACELDKIRGSAHLSLVAFEFRDTKVLGVRWPGFTNFPEINLRFYVRHQGRRGVCFIKEYVPSRLIAGAARLLYNEPYQAAPMSAATTVDGGKIKTHHRLQVGGAVLELEAEAENAPVLPPENSVEHLFKEHSLGVGKNRSGRRQTYEVNHPLWKIYPQAACRLTIDWEKLYGPRFRFLQDRRPDSVVFAEGSDISVRWRRQSTDPA